MALGAQRGDVLRMVVRQALVLAVAGIVIGGAGALLLTRLMEGLLFRVKPADPMTFAVVSGILAGGRAPRELHSRPPRHTRRSGDRPAGGVAAGSGRES